MTTALLSGIIVALVVVAGIATLAWAQIRRERHQRSNEASATHALELHRTRLASYPALFEAITPLSTYSRATMTAEVAGEVAEKLHIWLYSTGGLCAGAMSRGAVLGLRDSCALWAAKGGSRPPQLYEFRNLAIMLLRRDLELAGLEPFDANRALFVLNKLREDLELLDRRADGRDRPPLIEQPGPPDQERIGGIGMPAQRGGIVAAGGDADLFRGLHPGARGQGGGGWPGE